MFQAPSNRDVDRVGVPFGHLYIPKDLENFQSRLEVVYATPLGWVWDYTLEALFEKMASHLTGAASEYLSSGDFRKEVTYSNGWFLTQTSTRELSYLLKQYYKECANCGLSHDDHASGHKCLFEPTHFQTSRRDIIPFLQGLSEFLRAAEEVLVPLWKGTFIPDSLWRVTHAAWDARTKSPRSPKDWKELVHKYIG